jgi:L-lactate dehydrogenase complex protein LldF
VSEPAGDLTTRARTALGDAFLRGAVRFTADRLRTAKDTSTDALGRWQEWRDRGEAVRAHVVAHLDFYLEQFRRQCEAAGGRVHFAADAAEARALFLRIARARGARRVVKSKSMVTEEIHLNQHLEALGLECVETDLGEWIVQLAGETPSHIILPAIHKSRDQIRALFEAEGGVPLQSDTKTLAGHARGRLRQKFLAADIGVSGANFLVAETGSIAVFTNEGNGRLVTTLPRTHVAFVGMERIVPTLADLELMAQLLPRSATGQKLTTYLHLITGPRRPDEADGPEELHVIVLDNGRSQQLGDAAFQDVLHCIRCGACLNVCPVYRQIGGHAYGSVYPGPIGAVLSPRLDPQHAGLADASSLCGACFDACPVKIPLHDMLARQRSLNVATPVVGRAPRWAMAIMSRVLASPTLFALAGWTLRAGQRLLFGADGSRGRDLQRLLAPVAAWTRHRCLPPAPWRPFRALWSALERET